MAINGINEQINVGAYRFSTHAIERMIQRQINRTEIEEAISNGLIIEDYPDDKYAPSCLIYGQTNAQRDLHILVSIPPKVVIITVYEPSPDEWIDCQVRR